MCTFNKRCITVKLTVNVEEGDLLLTKVVVGTGKQQVIVDQNAVVKAGSPLAIALPDSRAKAKSKKTKRNG